MSSNYVESKLMTRFGEFNIRVYAAPKGHETVVLWKGSLHSSSSILVRVHSECLTGDALGGLNCDCGKQLAKALTLMQKEGGILIYLRQEGRGIGLFEKIKSYRFQRQGYDTSEANVILGHCPDERTYEMAKIVLDDLRVSRIRLLTNNPAKISELAKYGIEVTERVPLIIRPNKYNRDYFLTKKTKFSHFFDDENYAYFYQFHVDTPDQVKTIGEFLQDKKADPLLTICVGITANSSVFKDKNEIANIRSIYDSCNLYANFVPVLHFSFRGNQDILSELKKIKKMMPFVKRVQINDFSSLKLNDLKLAFRFFELDIPLSDENFDLIENQKIRNLLKRRKSFVILDNSKGRGIQEPKKNIMKKIDALLDVGINNIGVFGGFGPNELQSFFELKRYYHLNFSIDAETKLKTNDKVDIKKTKTYLLQLLRFDNDLLKKEQKLELQHSGLKTSYTRRFRMRMPRTSVRV